MSNADPAGNPLYAKAENLHAFHWEVLGRRPPGEVLAAAGVTARGHTYLLSLLGRVLAINPERRQVLFEDDPDREVSYQRALVGVSYLSLAMEVPPAGRWVAFRELPGGEAFFRGPHSLATPKLEEVYGDDPGGLLRSGAPVGGRPCEGAEAGLDVAAVPRIPLRVLLWARTEEFPARAQLLTDARAHLHLPLDVLWALTNVAVGDLVRERVPCIES